MTDKGTEIKNVDTEEVLNAMMLARTDYFNLTGLHDLMAAAGTATAISSHHSRYRTHKQQQHGKQCHSLGSAHLPHFHASSRLIICDTKMAAISQGQTYFTKNCTTGATRERNAP